jgi:hypothetical protein
MLIPSILTRAEAETSRRDSCGEWCRGDTLVHENAAWRKATHARGSLAKSNAE